MTAWHIDPVVETARGLAISKLRRQPLPSTAQQLREEMKMKSRLPTILSSAALMALSGLANATTGSADNCWYPEITQVTLSYVIGESP